MIGSRLEAPSVFPFYGMLFAAAGLLLCAIGAVQKEYEFIAVSSLPFFWSFVAFVRRRGGFQCDVTADALIIEHPPEKISYESIQSIHMGRWSLTPDDRRLKPGTLVIIHDEGVTKIPRKLNHSPTTVLHLYAFLWQFVNGSGSRKINSELSEFLAEQESTFGYDMVYTFRARNRPGVPTSTAAVQAYLVATMLAGIVWIVMAVAWDLHDSILGLGWFFALTGGISWLIAWAAGRTTTGVRGWQDASLVISPGGLALIQGPVRGILRWEEVQKIETQGKARTFRMSHLYGISLQVAGASIVIADIYDRPPAVIAKLIETYWRPSPTLPV